MYLPFWRIKAGVSGIDLDSYADLVKIANLPKAMQENWNDVPFYFWAPAFKIRPKVFLRLANNVTLAQPRERLLDSCLVDPSVLWREIRIARIDGALAELAPCGKIVEIELPDLAFYPEPILSPGSG